MNDRSLPEILSFRGGHAGCTCQIWTGADECCCENEPDVRHEDRLELIARRRYERTKPLPYWQKGVVRPTWDELTDAQRAEYVHETRVYLLRNGG